MIFVCKSIIFLQNITLLSKKKILKILSASNFSPLESKNFKAYDYALA